MLQSGKPSEMKHAIVLQLQAWPVGLDMCPHSNALLWVDDGIYLPTKLHCLMVQCKQTWPLNSTEYISLKQRKYTSLLDCTDEVHGQLWKFRTTELHPLPACITHDTLHRSSTLIELNDCAMRHPSIRKSDIEISEDWNGWTIDSLEQSEQGLQLRCTAYLCASTQEPTPLSCTDHLHTWNLQKLYFQRSCALQTSSAA